MSIVMLDKRKEENKMEISFGSNVSYKPYIKINSQKGRIFKGEKAADGSDIEIQLPFTFIANLEVMKTGWLEFPMAGAPSFVWDEKQFVAGPRPSPKHTRGFGLELSNIPICGGVVELNNNSKNVCEAMVDLFTPFVAQRSAHPSLYPVVTITGMKGKTVEIPAKGNNPPVKATNYKPIWSITEWVKTDVFNKDNVIQLQSAAPTTQAQNISVLSVESQF